MILYGNIVNKNWNIIIISTRQERRGCNDAINLMASLIILIVKHLNIGISAMDISLQSERRSQTSLDRKNDHRTYSERDLARLIHSATFRRLQAKTQVLGIGEGDFHRTRLTHSMEVAQIGKGIARNILSRNTHEGNTEILPDSDLIFCIGLAHDLGHPPFGHGGEIALNYCMRDHGGFEGNGQTLRILSKIEAHTPDYGLDLTRRTLLGILKYPINYNRLKRTKDPILGKHSMVKASDWKPPKCYLDDEIDVVEWIIQPFSESDKIKFTNHSKPSETKHGKPTEKSVDTSIMELADDIAYGVHDLEDGIALNLITHEMWMTVEEKLDKDWMEKNEIIDINKMLFGNSSQRKRAIGALVNSFMINTIVTVTTGYDCLFLKNVVSLTDKSREALDLLKSFVRDNIIKIPEVQTLEFRGQQIVIQIFDAIASDPKRFLKKSFKEEWERADSEAGKLRVVCDYISGMTDEYATRMYERLFIPRHGTVFQRL